MIRGIHHVAMNTADLGRLVAFYRDIIGFEVIAEGKWQKSEIIDEVVGLKGSVAKQAMLRAGNCYLEIFEYTSPAARPGEPLRACDRGYTHLCLDVMDIQAEYNRLSAKGVKFNRPPADFGEVKAVYGRDPDGNLLEIQEVVSDGCPFRPSGLNHLCTPET